ncbi:MAG: bifunctional nuclease family protein [Chloroflexi bacterium]|nr:bifunctional nuclease family protein [Chloroflexota bacterium]
MIVGHVFRRLVRGMALGIARRWFTTLLALVLIGTAGYAVAARGMIPGVTPFAVGGLASLASVQTSEPTSTDVRELTVEEVRPMRNGDRIDLILKEKAGNRRLVMSVGQMEALAIYADLNTRVRSQVDTPTSYELMGTIVQQLGGTVNRVVVNQVTNDTFYAKVIMSTESRQVEIDSKPSDAIALALRTHAPIFAEASVLDRAGVRGSN